MPLPFSHFFLFILVWWCNRQDLIRNLNLFIGCVIYLAQDYIVIANSLVLKLLEGPDHAMANRPVVILGVNILINLICRIKCNSYGRLTAFSSFSPLLPFLFYYTINCSPSYLNQAFLVASSCCSGHCIASSLYL